ncbi:MAG: S41 family peptidase [Gemmatimonadota bacterium]|nr:MAG: S41 family peptidase [Gemmatimonadota bacterium]
MRLRRRWVTPLAVALIALVSGGWLLQQGTAREDAYAQSRLLDEVLRLISERYVEETDPAELYRMAIEGLLAELGDPYTDFLDREEWQDLQLSTTGNYGGLGIRIDEQDGWITVVSVLPNTPAERRGLMTGDRIVEVGGESAEGWSTTDAVQILRGPKGSVVELVVVRPGVERLIELAIERDEIHVISVKSFMLDDGVGFVRLEQFSREARGELQAAIDALQGAGASSIILDLRGNPGGLLEEGIAVADLFLPRGVEVVETRSRNTSENQGFTAPSGEAYPGLPIVVLVGPYSASASEIVAGALQDHDRALIIGTTTFGKGLVQTLYPLSGGNYLKMTTARWYTPSGRTIQKPFRDGALELLAGGAISMEGDPVHVADALENRETFYTDAGRVVYGGGGITPDIVVMPDTLTTAEQRFREVLAESDLALRDATFRFSVHWVRDHPDLGEDFEVTPAIRQAFYQFLTVDEEAGVARDLYDDAAGWVDWELGIRLAQAAFGEEASLKRTLRRQPQVSKAVALLRQTDTPQGLLALAASESAAAGAKPN